VIAPFVDAAWVAARADDVVLADVRWYLDGRSGRAAYEEGHLPGAVFVDLDTILAAPPSAAEGRHPLPPPEGFAEGLAAAGISDDAVVVGYDDAGGVNASRLVWMLRAIGQDAALLDGGISTASGPLEQGASDRPRAQRTPKPWPTTTLAGIDELETGVLLDARAHARYRGDIEPVDPRTGHIPGARNLPASEMVTADGFLRPDDELRGQVAAIGLAAGDAAITSCGSGVVACFTALVLEHLGHEAPLLYPGGFSQWSNTDRPVATGDAAYGMT
jgi:thiosulfate/3-mercaptopyruvate sulfurtransferase